MDLLKLVEESIDEKYKSSCVVYDKRLIERTIQKTGEKIYKEQYNIEVKLLPSIFRDKATSYILFRVYPDYILVWDENKDENGMQRIEIDNIYDVNLTEIIHNRIIRVLSFPAFGCCSKYTKCSDERHCLHEDYLYSTACSYRKNLESGKIFFGKNKNI